MSIRATKNDIAIGDLDNDGDREIVAIKSYNDISRILVYSNDGTGHFDLSTQR